MSCVWTQDSCCQHHCALYPSKTCSTYAAVTPAFMSAPNGQSAPQLTPLHPSPSAPLLRGRPSALLPKLNKLVYLQLPGNPCCASHPLFVLWGPKFIPHGPPCFTHASAVSHATPVTHLQTRGLNFKLCCPAHLVHCTGPGQEQLARSAWQRQQGTSRKCTCITHR